MNNELRHDAEDARKLYRNNLINREEATRRIAPFIEAYNIKTIEVAKKYNQRPKKISIASFLR